MWKWNNPILRGLVSTMVIITKWDDHPSNPTDSIHFQLFQNSKQANNISWTNQLDTFSTKKHCDERIRWRAPPLPSSVAIWIQDHENPRLMGVARHR